jgi:hypothetical protein
VLLDLQELDHEQLDGLDWLRANRSVERLAK